MEDVYLVRKEIIPQQTLSKLNEKWIDFHGGIPVDECIGKEIENLIVNGVVTVGSCCGHGKYNAHSLAFISEKEKIEALGYKTEKYENNLIKFNLKSGTQI
jgi:hypothetical protein